jgi:molybdopterin molybdotransferase
MSWGRARRIATAAAGPRPAVEAALTEAIGCRLAADVRALAPIPSYDVVAADGFAVSGPGPWLGVELATAVPDGRAVPVVQGDALPVGATAVLPYPKAVERKGSDGFWIYVGDRGRDEPDWRPGHLEPGSHVVPRGSDAPAGATLAAAGSLVTPAVVAAAAESGADLMVVVRPPDVAVITVGDDRWDHGGSRDGRRRDATTPMILTAVIRAGGRCQPVREIPGHAGHLRTPVQAALDDAAADLVLITGPAGEAARGDVAHALSQLRATPLVAAVAMAAGADSLLAELPDGRLVAYVPGDLAGAVCALVTIVLPILRVMGGHPEPPSRSALLSQALPGAADRMTLVAASHTRGELADSVAPTTGPDVAAFSAADVLIVVPSSGAPAGALVELVDLP